jgi:hypothetical protein
VKQKVDELKVDDLGLKSRRTVDRWAHDPQGASAVLMIKLVSTAISAL